MTTAVTESTGRQLDFTGDSIQLTTRKGADLLWVHRFLDSDGNPLDITSWDFERNIQGAQHSGGAVRNGTSTGAPDDVLRDFRGMPLDNNNVPLPVVPAGQPLTVGIDIQPIVNQFDAQETYMVDQVTYDMGNDNLNIFFPSGTMTPDVPDNMFFRITAGVFTFEFQSSMALAGSGGWQVIGSTSVDSTTGMPATTFNGMSPPYTLEQRDTAFEFADMIQCYFKTELLTNVNPSSGRSNQAAFEIEAEIPVPGRTHSDGTAVVVTQVVTAGQINVFSDVFTATTNQP